MFVPKEIKFVSIFRKFRKVFLILNCFAWIAIWTAEGNNNDAILEIGNKLKDRLGLGPKHELKYHLHADTMVKTGSQAKAIYSL